MKAERHAMETETTTRELLDLLIGGWRAQAISTAASLGIPDQLDGQVKSVAEIAALTETDPDSLQRLLRLLVGLRILEGDDSAGFSLAPRGKLLRTNSPLSFRDLAICYGEIFSRCWFELMYTVRTGEPAFPRVFGKPLFEHLAEHPCDARTFDGAMAAGSAFFADMSTVYDFSAARTVVDIGGGNGALLMAVLAGYPHLRGILVETDHVAEAALGHLRAAGVEHRCEIVAADFFESIPSRGDVYLLSRVLQDWADDDCLRLLRTCHKAMDPGSELLVVERVIPEDGTHSLSLEWDIQLMLTVGGLLRTGGDYRSLFHKAGFDLNRVIPLPLDVHIFVATPLVDGT
jgi:O-methyltransferase domain/Dimerisation domain